MRWTPIPPSSQPAPDRLRRLQPCYHYALIDYRAWAATRAKVEAAIREKLTKGGRWHVKDRGRVPCRQRHRSAYQARDDGGGRNVTRWLTSRWRLPWDAPQHAYAV